MFAQISNNIFFILSRINWILFEIKEIAANLMSDTISQVTEGMADPFADAWAGRRWPAAYLIMIL